MLDASIASLPCGVARRMNITLEEFERDYLDKLPVVFSDLGANAAFRDRCDRARLVQEWGNHEITLSSANSYSYDKERTTLAHYVADMMGPQDERDGRHTFYHFGDHQPSFTLLDAYVLPRVHRGQTPSLSWGLAGDVSGVPFHVHGPVYAEVLHGRKHWLITAPDERPQFDPDEPPVHWMQRYLAGNQPQPGLMQCTLQPGEILYVRLPIALHDCRWCLSLSC